MCLGLSRRGWGQAASAAREAACWVSVATTSKKYQDELQGAHERGTQAGGTVSAKRARTGRALEGSTITARSFGKRMGLFGGPA